MVDLEKAILISFDESGTVDSGLKSQAVAYCQQMKDTPSICSLCIERLAFTKLVQVQFWCLQTLQDVIKLRYSSMGLDEKSFVRKSVFSMASLNDKNLMSVLDSPAFIKNKLAQVLVTLIYFEYPAMWSSVFFYFLPQLFAQRSVMMMLLGHSLGSLIHLLIGSRYVVQTTGNVLMAFNNKEASLAIPLFSPVLVPMAQSIGPLLSQIASSPTIRLGAEMTLKQLENLSPPIMKQVLPLVEQLPPLYADLVKGREDFFQNRKKLDDF